MSATAPAADRKVLEVVIDEATNLNRDSQVGKEDELTEGFMKVEVRGPDGTRPVKVSTKTVSVTADKKMIWHEALHLDLFEGSSELRLLLCREQTSNGRRSVHVVCACGIFVQHILDAVPIDKYFEMFKPGSGSDGGFVRLKMRLMSNSDMKQKKGQGKAKGVAMLASVALGAVALGFAVMKSKK